MVIDEYPYLAASERSISSLLQSYIDNYFINTNLFMILCGSSMSFMENQVLGYQSPLYGRRTAQFKINSFDYYTASQFVKRYNEYEKAIIYGITGGVPKYLELVDDAETLKENIIALFLKPNAYLFEEPSNLLKQELREPAIYNAIIEVIASGALRMNDISNKVGLESGQVSTYIKSLISIGVIKKELAITDEKNRKRTLYRLEDTMFSFWYRYIPSNLMLVLGGDSEIAYDEFVKPNINNFMGYVFEEMCKQYLQKINREGLWQIRFSKLGRWWGNDPKNK